MGSVSVGVTARWRRVSERVRAHPVLVDTLLAALLFVAVTGLTATMPRSYWPDNVAAALIWSALGLVAVAIRRLWPWWAALILSAHTVVTVALEVSSEGLAILIVTYTVAAYLPLRQSAAATALMWLPGLVTAGALGHYEVPPAELTFTTFVLFQVMAATVAYLAGRVMFTRRRYVAALVERAHTAEQSQQALTTQAVQDERRRIARELHDMVAHHVSVMGVLATGSRRMLRKDLNTADEALATIEETSRTALREMRRLLDVLRTDPEPADPLAPQPGLAGLSGLVEQVRDAGLQVTLRNSGEPATLDPGVALTVYRIVQEALTNVIKHGGNDATAEVRLDFGRQWLTLEIYDTGLGPPARSGNGRADGVGHGLLGMQERVALFGGTLRTGPRPGGGFRVYARIPIEDTP